VGGAALDSVARQLWLPGAWGGPLESSKPTRKSRRREEEEEEEEEEKEEEEEASCTYAKNAALVTAGAHPFDDDE
jgi:hypothetical protein